MSSFERRMETKRKERARDSVEEKEEYREKKKTTRREGNVTVRTTRGHRRDPVFFLFSSLSTRRAEQQSLPLLLHSDRPLSLALPLPSAFKQEKPTNLVFCLACEVSLRARCSPLRMGGPPAFLSSVEAGEVIRLDT